MLRRRQSLRKQGAIDGVEVPHRYPLTRHVSCPLVMSPTLVSPPPLVASEVLV